MSNIANILGRAVVSEKSHLAQTRGVYTFFVEANATKVDIRKLFERLYGVTVEKVNISKIRPKFHNTKLGVLAKRGEKVKAMITLKKGQTITDFSNFTAQ